VPHELTPANKAKRVQDARTLLQALRSDSEKHFAHIMTRAESWFCDSYELATMFGHGRTELNSRVSWTRSSKRAMIALLFTSTRLLKLIHLPQGHKGNKEYFTTEILEGIDEQCNHGAGYRITKTMKIPMYKSR
jgi:hypothetical protein